MEKKRGNQTVGLILLIVGIYWACKALDIFHFSIFFDGWWTLFIIVPCLCGFLQRKSRGGNLIGVLFGIMLLLWRQGVISGSYIPAVFIAMIFILIGISIMMKGTKQSAENAGHYEQASYGSTEGTSTNAYSDSVGSDNSKKAEQNAYSYSESASYTADDYSRTEDQSDRGRDEQQSYEYHQSDNFTSNNRSTYETCPPNISAILVGKSVSCLNGVFHGTSVQSVLGNVQLDLRQAKLVQDVYVNVNLILGGADIYLPEDVRVVCDTENVLGDVRDIRKSSRNMDPMVPAIYIKGNCILGGLELK